MAKVKFLKGQIVDGYKFLGGDYKDENTWVEAPPTPVTDRQKLMASAPMRFLQGLRDPIDAGAQMLPRGLAALTSGFGAAPNAVSEFLKNQAQQVDEGVLSDEAEYRNARAATGNGGVDVARIAGNVVPTVAGSVAAGGIPVGATLGARMGIGAATGAGFGALQPVHEGAQDEFAKEKAKQVVLGAVVGGAMPVVTGGLARLIQPKVPPNIAKLRAEGIHPTPGQAMGGMVGGIEEKAKSIPLVGDVITGSQREVEREMNRAAWNRALMPIGKSMPKDLRGRDAAAFADDAIDDVYDRWLSSFRPAAPDRQLISELSSLQGMVNTLPKDRGDQYAAIVKNEIVDRIDQYGKLTPEALKLAESNIGKLIRDYGRANDGDQMLLGQALREAQASLRSWLARAAGPDAAKELKNVNKAYANFLRPLRASAAQGAGEGEFSAAQLSGAVRALDPSKHKKAFATGNALMQDLSDPAKAVLAQKIPNSGTADRALLAAMLANPAQGALLGLPAILAKLPYSSLGRKALTISTKRPAGAKAIDEILRKLSPYLPAGVAPLFNEP